ncbi:MAG: ADP-ribose pyrophosphatase [Acidimicrobiales bacterium]|nr:ADP-ribose pyrophosphatase [Acidimicrobiales bacterium]
MASRRAGGPRSVRRSAGPVAGRLSAVRAWLVGGAVIEGPEGVLLVQNRRRDGRVDWSPPGGVIDHGEELLDGLRREVVEETGLLVHGWHGPIYEIEAVAPDLGWTLRVEAHLATEVTGELVVDDPDGIVVDACYVPGGRCGVHLAEASPWVREPLSEWLDERWSGTRQFSYRIAGADRGSLEVTRLG